MVNFFRGEGVIRMATLTTSELARQLGTDPRTLRRFLRDAHRGVGQGKRYALPANKAQISSLSRKFQAWKGQ